VDVSGGVAGDPIDHVNLLKVFFSSEIASVTVPCQLRQPGLFSLFGLVVFVRFWMRLRAPKVGLYGQIGYL
jgi:hypothetical protein